MKYVAAFLLLFVAFNVSADDLEKGREAYQAGNYEAAFKWFRKSAEQGNANAQYNLGVMYDNGRGVLKDEKAAVKWWRKSAEQGDAKAQYNLGLMYHNGEGVLKDEKAAVEWWRKAVLSSPPDKINIKFLKQFPEFVAFLGKKSEKDDSGKDTGNGHESTETPEERIESAYQEITTDIKSELLSKILDASPEFFETLIVDLLVAMGYGGSSVEAGEHLGKSGDGGIDGVIKEDKLGLDMIYVQAKRYAPENTVGRPAINGFVGSLVGFAANKGVFVTTSSFSKHAQEYANTVPQRIILIDGEKLTSLMLENDVGVRLHQAIELKRIDEDFFME